jgi:hypothetical protein
VTLRSANYTACRTKPSGHPSRRQTLFERLDAVGDRRVRGLPERKAKRNSGQGLPITVEHDRFARQRH